VAIAVVIVATGAIAAGSVVTAADLAVTAAAFAVGPQWVAPVADRQ
jgi:hypothetical protein